ICLTPPDRLAGQIESVPNLLTTQQNSATCLICPTFAPPAKFAAPRGDLSPFRRLATPCALR
ncbi:MAG: hypothetical protein ACREBP_10735, partial [Sphingomicrobium sp.]